MMNKKSIYKIVGFALLALYIVLVVIFRNSEAIKANKYCEIILPFVLLLCVSGGITFLVLGFKKSGGGKKPQKTLEEAQNQLKRTEKSKNVALVVIGIGVVLFLMGFINMVFAKIGAIIYILGVFIGIFSKEKCKMLKKYIEETNNSETAKNKGTLEMDVDSTI
ncbi:MAG: hypothetical protein J5590_08570 [Clostridia bacterium]|nr:hypothetical protein [Clostridia bacterium]